MNNIPQRRILISPLDWGLGHATRCIPIIKCLLDLNCVVIVATSGAPQAVLHQAFGNSIQYIHLQGYNISYSRNWVFAKLITQIPQIKRAIKQEQLWLQTHIDQLQPHGIISDNRYGFYHKSCPSVLITHQLNLHLPTAFRPFITLVNNRLAKFIAKFNACWVPDIAQIKGSISGLLGHPEKSPLFNTQYIGWLSSWPQVAKVAPKDKKIDILVLLSGLEPQRTLLEEKCTRTDLTFLQKNITVVQGLANAQNNAATTTKNLSIVAFAPATMLAELAANSKLIICRSGYSTLMDLLPLQIPMLLVPTPGQTEQEYLAQRLYDAGIAPFIVQSKFTINKAIEIAENFNYQQVILEPHEDKLNNIIANWVKKLS